MVDSKWVTGVNSHPSPTPMKGLKKKWCHLLEVEVFLLRMFRVKSDVKYKPIPSKFECLHSYVWWVYFSVWSTMKIIIILSAILGVACPLKANIFYILQVLTKVCIFLKKYVFSDDLFNILYNSALKLDWPCL